jgi:hypothetical protein
MSARSDGGERSVDASGLPETWEQMIDHLGYPEVVRIVERPQRSQWETGI